MRKERRRNENERYYAMKDSTMRIKGIMRRKTAESKIKQEKESGLQKHPGSHDSGRQRRPHEGF